MNDAAYKTGAALIARGFPVIVVWGVDDDGNCTCPRGASCTAAGKHPVGSGWQNQAITDESDLYDAIGDSDTPMNIGIPFGPKSGLIDVEYDSADGAATAADLGLPECGTVSFTSSRSRHFLFRYDERLPEKAVLPNVSGLEVRIGAGDRGAHSVAPGSRHKSGTEYAWVPSCSIEETDVLPIPPRLLTLLLEHESSGKTDCANLMRSTGMIETGGRHDAVRKTAFHLAASMRGEETPANLDTAYTCVSALNELRCDPPLDDSEVRVLVASAFSAYSRWSRQDQLPHDAAEKFNSRCLAVQAGEASPGTIVGTDLDNTVATSGIEPIRGEEGWSPGTWRLEIVDATEREYTLILRYTHIDAAGNRTRRDARVTLTPAEFRNSDVVATRVMNATGTLDLNPVPGFFAGVWNGKAATKTSDAVIGLRAKLLAAATLVEPEAGSTPWIMFARAFIACLTVSDRETATCDRPDDNGDPTWVDGHGLAFLWSQVIARATDQCRTATEDSPKKFRNAIKSHFNGEDLVEQVRFRDSRGKQRRFQVISESNLDRLCDWIDSLS